jgi:predicted Rossmann-fold nucleotide-binding protein
MGESKLIQIGKSNLDSSEVCNLLDQVAHRVYVDKHHAELAPLLEQSKGLTRTELTLDEFFRVGVGPGKLIAGYSGACKNADEQSQSESVYSLGKELKDIVGGILHGGTMWGFMRTAHESAVENNMLSIGVMPWHGVVNLLAVKDQLGKDFQKMDYLAISGDDYQDHCNLFAQKIDYLVLLGGRSGALAEANSAKVYHKPVITLVHKNENDFAFQNFQGGSWYTQNPEEAVLFVRYNLTPAQRLFNGTHVSVHEFDQRTIDKIRLTFLGNSGKKTDLGRHEQILEQLLMGISPSVSQKVEGVSGGTYLGGVQAFYDSCAKVQISRSGIMSRKGIGFKIADVDYLIAYGPEWGSESKVTERMSDVAIVLGGGKQTESEVNMLATHGGRAGAGIPIIVIDDPIIGNWSARRSLSHPNVHYFGSGQLPEASGYLNQVICKINNERHDVFH